ncbi:hypothetical protein Zmor_006677 [Zophobas morio]|uniref:Uncharacterized protein n=1 Tax=Zophobas morio TaxID=2755281 RepID=A0AA38IXY2_9CUCU|nr:hypothetical protein Zmor_006677 [Zophobas morio]
MSLKVVISICLIFTVLQTVLGAPNNLKDERYLEQKFVEFLQQDKELSSLLQNANAVPHTLSRNVRQAEEDFGSDGNEADDAGEPKPGFFDRAAKFVMEVLQRFLKWINTDN